jgi:hypothetical protein
MVNISGKISHKYPWVFFERDQHAINFAIDPLLRSGQTNSRLRLIDITVGGRCRIILLDPSAEVEPSRSVVALAGVNLGVTPDAFDISDPLVRNR